MAPALQLRRVEQANELARIKKRSGGIFGRLKSDGRALVAVPYSFARAMKVLPATPIPDTKDADAGSKSLATAEWMSSLLSREGTV